MFLFKYVFVLKNTQHPFIEEAFQKIHAWFSIVIKSKHVGFFLTGFSYNIRFIL